MALLDDFAGDGDLNFSAWQGDSNTAYQRVSGQCVFKSGATRATGYLTAFSGSTQHAQVKIVNVESNVSYWTPGPVIRGTTAVGISGRSGAGYYCSISGAGAIRLSRHNGSTMSTLKNSASGAVVDGDTIRLADLGSGQIRVYVNDVLVESGDFDTPGQYDDDSPLSGDYIGLYAVSLNPSSDWVIDDFAGGVGTGAGASASIIPILNSYRMRSAG